MSNHNHEHKTMTTMDLIKKYIASKIPSAKQSIVDSNKASISADPNYTVNHIAVILDGRVEEVLRAQNRLAALLLSQPSFIEFDPKDTSIKLGETTYSNGVFTTDSSQDGL